MNSYQWHLISVIFLAIGVILLICAVLIAARYKVVANLISEVKAKNRPSEPLKEVHSAAAADKGGVTETAVNNGDDDDYITVVVGNKKTGPVNDTIVLSKNNSSLNDFRILRNIIMINADPDVIDEHRSKR